MNVFILIMVIAVGGSNRGVTTLTAEFNSFQTCEFARKWTAQRADHQGTVISQGCFKK